MPIGDEIMIPITEFQLKDEIDELNPVINALDEILQKIQEFYDDDINDPNDVLYPILQDLAFQIEQLEDIKQTLEFILVS
jgi:hypothetical protein